MTMTRTAGPKVAVDLGRRARVVCAVARTQAEQARGLQGHAPLGAGEGMLFPFHPPRAACFHMGTVTFPIDILFADASGRVAKIVHAAQPGSKDRWGVPIASAVIELAGGQASALGVRPGDRIQVAGRKLGIQTYNLLRTLTEADVHANAVDSGDWMQDGFYGREPQHAPQDYGGAVNHIGGPFDDNAGNPARFVEHNLPDEGGNPNAMDQPNPDWADVEGRDVGYYSDGLTNDLAGRDPLGGDNLPAATRMSAGAHPAGRRPGRRAQDMSERARPSYEEPRPSYTLDLKKLGPAILEAAFRAGLDWKPDPTNPAKEQVAVTPEVLGNWLHSLGMDDQVRSELHDALGTEQGLKAIGDVFTGGMDPPAADGATIKPWGHIPVLVLSRGKPPGIEPEQQKGKGT